VAWSYAAEWLVFAPPLTPNRLGNISAVPQPPHAIWHTLLKTGDIATIEEIAEAESINTSYVSRVLRMTLLAQEIVEARRSFPL
jgi:hypothetical protein